MLTFFNIIIYIILSNIKNNLFSFQIVEFFYSIFSASEVAYYTYIYAKVERTHYERVTSYTRGALLLGKASAGLSSQLFVYFNVFDYLQLNYLTVAGKYLFICLKN